MSLIITPSTKSLGYVTEDSVVSFTINSSDNSEMSIVVAIDGVTKANYSNLVNGTYSLAFDEYWSSLSYNTHTMTITVSDGNSNTAQGTYTFTKSINLQHLIDTTELQHFGENTINPIINLLKAIQDTLTVIDNRVETLEGFHDIEESNMFISDGHLMYQTETEETALPTFSYDSTDGHIYVDDSTGLFVSGSNTNGHLVTEVNV